MIFMWTKHQTGAPNFKPRNDNVIIAEEIFHWNLTVICRSFDVQFV